jgi:valyl-tRNA synthetase
MLAKRYDAAATEKKWQDFWLENRVFTFQPDSKAPVYSVDTPPPTVSGALHIGHVFSYTQAEIIIRHRRMKGFNVFYPFGFDDNGLPTERFVEKERKVRGSELGRSEFRNLCIETVQKAEEEFRSMWKSLGFSADWNLGYVTIDDLSRRISQRSFLDLYRKGHITHRDEPNMWCVACRTAIAQAELESVDQDSSFNDLRFALKNGGEIIIGTTRPELLPSCVSIFVHPEDERYKDIIGQTAIVPIFGQEVKVIADEKADPEKGTGAVMCCTFGDKTDIEWQRKHQLPLRISITAQGRMNELAQDFCGLKIKEARKNIIEKLQNDGILIASRQINHPVNTHERCGTDIEFLVTPQWFINITDKKEELLQVADKINWYPSFMKQRYIHWVENLNWDWCISRQRFFGVPFPVWHCEKCQTHVLPEDHELPVEPAEDSKNRTCPKCGSTELSPDRNIMDTWATSSVTPQINYRWQEKDSLEKQIAPMSLRPQAHDIIRTWAFYTIVKSWYHQQEIPWNDVMISGHVLYKKGQKFSKSKGEKSSGPNELIQRYSADVIRYWTAGARLGSDCYFEEQEFRIAQRLITKLFNAAKFAISHLENFKHPDCSKISFAVDQGFVSRLQNLIKLVDSHLESYEYSLALGETESFFWDFCDNYMELIKNRMYNPTEHPDGAKESACNSIYYTLYAFLRLFAPFIPHVTEEIYQDFFRAEEGHISLHIAPFPETSEQLQKPEQEKVYHEAKLLIGAARKYKTENRLSLNTELKSITCLKENFKALPEHLSDTKKASGAREIIFVDTLSGSGSEVDFEGIKILIETEPQSTE